MNGALISARLGLVHLAAALARALNTDITVTVKRQRVAVGD
ncbi:hypothetical protein [Streptomyces sp. NBC_01451]|nr:hypothetical protein [Streptomyces sp. NBC_01451]